MIEDQTSPKGSTRMWVVYSIATVVILLALGLFIETCESEKIRICDDATGDCTLESSCQPLIYSLFS